MAVECGKNELGRKEMPRFRPDLRHQTKLVPVSRHHQLHPGTFEYTLNRIIDRMNLAGLIDRYRNDETGTPAYNPAVLLKRFRVAE